MHKLVARLKTRDWIAPPVCASKIRLLGSSLRRPRGCRGRSGRGMGRHDHRLKPAPPPWWSSWWSSWPEKPLRRRSTVMVEDPPLGAFGAPTPEHSQNIRLHGSAQAITIRPAGIEGQCEDQHSAGGRDHALRAGALPKYGGWQVDCQPQRAAAQARRLSPQASSVVCRDRGLRRSPLQWRKRSDLIRASPHYRQK